METHTCHLPCCGMVHVKKVYCVKLQSSRHHFFFPVARNCSLLYTIPHASKMHTFRATMCPSVLNVIPWIKRRGIHFVLLAGRNLRGHFGKSVAVNPWSDGVIMTNICRSIFFPIKNTHGITLHIRGYQVGQAYQFLTGGPQK